jgi:lipopolysaccharide assembly protein A
MLLFLIVGLVIGAVAVIFILQNITPVSITFFTWHIDGSLSVILLLTLLVGMLVSAMILLPSIMKSDWELKRLRKRNKKLEDDLAINTTPMPSKVTEPAPVESENVVDLNN